MFKEKRLCFYEPVALLLLMLAMVCLTACSDNDDSDAPANATEMKLIVNGEHYDIALPATDAVDLVTLCREFDAEFQVENAAAFQTITIGGQPLTDGRCAFAIKDISKSAKIEIAYTTGDQQGTVTLNTLHSGIPEINASGRALIPGHFYLSFIYLRLIMKYDNSGDVIYYRYEPTPLSGTFSYRNAKSLTERSPYLVIDVDDLESEAEARQLMQRLISDPYVETELCFLSPKGRGVKWVISLYILALATIVSTLFGQMEWVLFAGNSTLPAALAKGPGITSVARCSPR